MMFSSSSLCQSDGIVTASCWEPFTTCSIQLYWSLPGNQQISWLRSRKLYKSQITPMSVTTKLCLSDGISLCVAGISPSLRHSTVHRRATLTVGQPVSHWRRLLPAWREVIAGVKVCPAGLQRTRREALNKLLAALTKENEQVWTPWEHTGKLSAGIWEHVGGQKSRMRPSCTGWDEHLQKISCLLCILCC